MTGLIGSGLIGGVLGWVAGNLFGWWVHDRPWDEPFNWRVLLGPRAYHSWLKWEERR